ncbi:MAG: SUMF1/EgtB/PvdO family nonheme iron enzyme [Bacteroidaceae bacterium]|nr:SUMF1/EgtB/PvdO family nonheme iron enzyme [Bacteroidaceae bacterium]
MNRRKYYLLLFFMLVATIQVAAQELVVRKFYLDERDFTANRGSTCILDHANNEPCALIKVRTNEHGFTFDAGQLLPIEKTEEQTPAHPLEIYVWVQSGAKRLSIGHKQLGNLYDFQMGDYIASGGLESGKTYIMELVSGEREIIIKEARTTQYVVFQLTPPEAVVELDGEMLATSDGTAQKPMPFGSYQYTVKAPNYQMEVGRIKVDDPKNKHIVTVNLKPNFAAITLTAPSGAEIWVDEQRKGTGSWTGNLGAGVHIFEARLAGHRPSQRRYDLVVANGPQTISLEAPKPIVGEAEITSNPALADIYIDGKKVGQTPQLISNLLVGSHSIKLSRKGYADYISTLTVKEGETASLTATMKKQETPAIDGGSATANAAGNLSFTVKGVTFTMVKVEAGTFTMGATEEQGSHVYDGEKPAHQVTLTKDYYIGQTEVTQALWQAVMGSNPSNFKGDNLPVEQVHWEDCQTFITKLNSLTDSKFRLPTEAEWEYAARGGNKSRGYKYSGSNSINDVAWYEETTNDTRTKPVATKVPNELGIYDMSGNVYEWCNDWYGSYSSSPQTNPTGASSGFDRVNRGGGWGSFDVGCRVSCRDNNSPGFRSRSVGLRLAQ